MKPTIHSDWKIIDHHHLTRHFKFPDFAAALHFVNQVAAVAESQSHHPNIHLTNWNQVDLDLFTHKINGLHQNDFILASKIDGII